MISPTHSERMCLHMAMQNGQRSLLGSLEMSHPAVADGSDMIQGLRRFHMDTQDQSCLDDHACQVPNSQRRRRRRRRMMRRRRRRAYIKSNNPHLTGGEKKKNISPRNALPNSWDSSCNVWPASWSSKSDRMPKVQVTKQRHKVNLILWRLEAKPDVGQNNVKAVSMTLEVKRLRQWPISCVGFNVTTDREKHGWLLGIEPNIFCVWYSTLTLEIDFRWLLPLALLHLPWAPRTSRSSDNSENRHANRPPKTHGVRRLGPGQNRSRDWGANAPFTSASTIPVTNPWMDLVLNGLRFRIWMIISYHFYKHHSNNWDFRLLLDCQATVDSAHTGCEKSTASAAASGRRVWCWESHGCTFNRLVLKEEIPFFRI